MNIIRSMYLHWSLPRRFLTPRRSAQNPPYLHGYNASHLQIQHTSGELRKNAKTRGCACAHTHKRTHTHTCIHTHTHTHTHTDTPLYICFWADNRKDEGCSTVSHIVNDNITFLADWSTTALAHIARLISCIYCFYFHPVRFTRSIL
jgi:hypothetical protein